MDEALLDEEAAVEKGYGTIPSAAVPKVSCNIVIVSGDNDCVYPR